MSSTHSPPIVVLARKKPHLILFEIVVFLSGLSVFVTDPGNEVPAWLNRMWGATLIATSMMILIGHLQRLDRERGLYVERAAFSLQSGLVLLYVGLIIAYARTEAAQLIIAIITALAWAVTNMWEVKLITTDLKTIDAVRALTPNPPHEPEAEVDNDTGA